MFLTGYAMPQNRLQNCLSRNFHIAFPFLFKDRGISIRSSSRRKNIHDGCHLSRIVDDRHSSPLRPRREITERTIAVDTRYPRALL
jgi:hypothetical protein